MARIGGGDFDAVRAANRKQAMVPVGAVVMDPVGTAPGVVVPGKPTVVVLPGPPRELQPMWKTAVQIPAVQEAIAGRTIYRQDTIRMFGLPESGLAETLREAEHEVPDFDRAGDHHLSAARRDRDGHPLRTRRRRHLPPADANCSATGTGSTSSPKTASQVDDQIAQLLTGRRIATAESCTGGTAGGPTHRAARFVGLPRRRDWWPTPTTRKPTCSVSIRR